MVIVSYVAKAFQYSSWNVPELPDFWRDHSARESFWRWFLWTISSSKWRLLWDNFLPFCMMRSTTERINWSKPVNHGIRLPQRFDGSSYFQPSPELDRLFWGRMTWPKVLDADSGLELFDGLGLGLPPVCFATRKAWNWNFDQTTATGHYLTAATMRYHTRRFWHGDGSSALNFQAVIGACQNDQQHKVLCHIFPQLRRLCLGRWLRTDSERVCVQKGANDGKRSLEWCGRLWTWTSRMESYWQLLYRLKWLVSFFLGPKAKTCSKNVHTGKFSSEHSRGVFHLPKVLASVLKDFWAQHLFLVSQVPEALFPVRNSGLRSIPAMASWWLRAGCMGQPPGKARGPGGQKILQRKTHLSATHWTWWF